MRFRFAILIMTAVSILSLLSPSQADAGLQPSVDSLNRMQIFAAQAVAEVEEARSALHSGSSQAITRHLHETRALLELIDSLMPAAEFHAMLRATQALMNFEDNAQVLPMFPRLFFALDDLPQSSSTKQAGAALHQALMYLKKPDRADALKALTQADDAFTDPTLTPPLRASNRDLAAALQSLSAGSRAQTDTDLHALAVDLLDLHKALATYPLNTP